MSKSLLSKITDYLNEQKNKSRQQKIFTFLAIIVFISTIYILMKPAITMEEVLICNLEEHTHTEECYEEKFICDETEENLNDETCYETNLIHQEEEHKHTTDCYGTDSDKESIEYLTNILDKLPTVDEMNTHIEELTSEEEQEEYKEEILATATKAYSYYLNLEEKVQTKITNIDKLFEYEKENLIKEEDTTSQVVTFNTSDDYGIETVLENDNSSNLDTVETADTSNIVEINLYDYFNQDEDGKSINYNFWQNNKYPGFFQSFGPDTGIITTDTIKNWRFNFGDMITTDRIGAIKDNDHTEIIANTINESMPSTGHALSGYIKKTLGDDGYPAIASGNLSLKYLFNESEKYAYKQNTDNINGLFQYDKDTGKYHFDSRNNFAQFNADTNTFTIYKQRLTSNFMIYPFGNFLPLNNIKTQTTQSSTINKAYFDKVIASAKVKANDKTTYGDMTTYYSRVASRMSEWLSVMKVRNNNSDNWDAAFVANQYFELSELPATIKTEQLTDIYNIDFDEPTNFFFGMDMEMTFIQPKNGITGVTEKSPMIFEFSGDDDVWVYIDGILFLDLSGRHRHVTGKINFAEGIVTYHALDKNTGDVSEEPYKTISFADILDKEKNPELSEIEIPELNENGTFKNYSSHNFKFYYMERGAGSSVMKMNFNFPLIEKNSLTVTKELDDSDVDLIGNPDFSFQILKVNEGEKTTDTFIEVGTEFDILDTNGNKVDTGKVLDNGIFKLKAGQTAVFKEISADKGDYYVREILDPTWVAQYETVTVDGESTTTNEDVVVGTEEFIGYESGIKDISDGHTSFVYTNKVDPYEFGTLKITKKLEGITNIDDVFKFKVTIDGEILPLDYKYTITDEEGNIIAEDIPIEKDCDECEYGYVLISAGQTAIIENILAGSNYKVEEIISSISGFDVEYDNEEGDIVSEEVVEITVTNISTGTDLKIPITKTIANPDGEPYSYSFKITEMESSSIDANEKTNGFKDEVTIENVTDTKTLQEAFKLEYSRPNYNEETTNHYYKIEEISSTDTNTKYDASIYIVKVTVTNTEDTFNAKVTKIYKDYINITEKDDNDNVTNTIEFINKLLSDLTITKEVQGNIEDSGEFEFELEIIDADTPITGTYNYQKTIITEEVITFQDTGITPFGEEQQETDSTNTPEEGTVTFNEEGKATIELAHNEVITIYGIPYDAQVKITELNTNGYVVMHNINSGSNQEGDIATVNLDRDNTNIKFINIGGYLLPATGGSGTLISGIIGLLLLIVPIIYIGYSFYKNRRSVV